MTTVQFYFGLGSRYSYLAATQIPKLAAETGARFEWRPMHSRDLIARTGTDPFRPDGRRGQYDPIYRTVDATRWANHYGVPYREPDWEAIDWARIALAATAASHLGAAQAFALKIFEACFGTDRAPREDAALERMAIEIGLDGAKFRDALNSPETVSRQSRTIDEALAAGAFGVPTFVLPGGELFWGQDRLPLLRQRLMELKA